MLKIGKTFIPIAVAAAMLAAGAAPAYAATDTIYIDQPITLTDNSGRRLASDVLATLETTATQADVDGYSSDSSFDYPADVDDATYGSKADMWDVIYMRDFDPTTIVSDDGDVISGVLRNDPYSGTDVTYEKGGQSEIDIEHVVARSEAWDSGAYAWDQDKRDAFANDPLELMAVSSGGNRAHGEKDAAEWLPSVGVKSTGVKNPSYDCNYVARQIAVKAKYELTVDEAERQAMTNVLATCPAQTVPLESDGEYWESNTTAPGTGEEGAANPDDGQDDPTVKPEDPTADPENPSDDPTTDTDDPNDPDIEKPNVDTDSDASEDPSSPNVDTDDTDKTDTTVDDNDKSLPQTGVRSPMFMGVIIIGIILLAAGIGILYYVLNHRNKTMAGVEDVELKPSGEPSVTVEAETLSPGENGSAVEDKTDSDNE